MRKALILGVALSYLIPATSAASIKDAREWAKARSGKVSFHVITSQDEAGFKSSRTYSSASVVKAMLLVAYLRKVRDRDLRGWERDTLGPMIKVSDNSSATQIRDIVGNGALEKLARRAQMQEFSTASSWGSTQISARDQARFFFSIKDFLPQRHERYAMKLLARVTPSQRWGAGGVFANWKSFFKGGWYPDAGGWRVHQVARVKRRGQPSSVMAVCVLTSGQPSYQYGQATVEGVMKRLKRV